MDPAEMLRRGYTRETKIRRDARGKWFDGDVPLEHPGLVKSFDGWLDRAPDGRLCLSNDINWAYVEVEGPPYRVRAVEVGEAIRLRLSGGREETLDPKTLRQDAQGALWCDVREGKLAARFENHATNQLADVLEEDAEGPFLRIAGEVVRPPVVEDPLQVTSDEEP